jgi:hypothetical protein
MLKLIGPICKFWRKLCVCNTTSGTAFIWLHFLLNLQIELISHNFTLYWAGQANQGQILLLFGPTHKLGRKLSVLNMASGTILTTLQFPRTYIIRMDPISYIKLSYSPARGKQSSLLGPICKFWTKFIVRNTASGTVFTALHFRLNLWMDPTS